jgi:hypothetical protein
MLQNTILFSIYANPVRSLCAKFFHEQSISISFGEGAVFPKYMNYLLTEIYFDVLDIACHGLSVSSD